MGAHQALLKYMAAESSATNPTHAMYDQAFTRSTPPTVEVDPQTKDG